MVSRVVRLSNLTPEWIIDAKQDATRMQRLTTAVEWMAEGKPRNWKYMKK